MGALPAVVSLDKCAYKQAFWAEITQAKNSRNFSEKNELKIWQYANSHETWGQKAMLIF